jgi:hypothetical protein
MRYSIGLTRLPLPQFVWASIDKRVEKTTLAPAETVTETAAKEDDNV